MARRIGTALTATLLLAMLAPASPALAGGGCHSGVTQGAGDTVELVEACPMPTILHVDVGATVTFVNEDPFVHNIIGNLWGHYDDLDPGDAFTASFDEPGIYPYACWYHPGMTGAVLVGDGTGAGNGQMVSVATFQQPSASPVVEIRTVTQETSTPAAMGWIVGCAVGLALGLGLGAIARRRARGTA